MWKEIPCRFAIGVTLAACVGCASHSKLPFRSSGPWCDTQGVLVVQNHSDLEVEIVEYRKGSSQSQLLQFVGPGRHEIIIRGESDFYYRAKAPRGERALNQPRYSATAGTRAPERDITLTKECREQ